MYMSKKSSSLCFAVLLLLGCCGLFYSGTPEEKIKSQLKAEGINVTDVRLDGGVIIVTYNQLASADVNNVYATWAYIFAVSVKNSPPYSSAGDQSVTIVCKFDDGEIMNATARAGDILDFVDKKTTAWEFLYTVDAECVTNCTIE